MKIHNFPRHPEAKRGIYSTNTWKSLPPLSLGVGKTLGVAAVAILLSGNVIADPQYQLMGSIYGLKGTLVLSNNGADVMSVGGNGVYYFRNTMPSGTPYNVIILSQPANQTCQVTNGNGAVYNNITNFIVNCTSHAYTVGGMLRGLTKSRSVILQNNGDDIIALSSDGSFTFRLPLAYDAPYSVRVISQPENQTCTVQNGFGIVNDKVMNVDVRCVLNLKTFVR